MKSRRWLTLVCVFWSAAVSHVQASDCPEPGTLVYPMYSLLQTEGLSLEFDFSQTEYFDYGSPEDVAQNRETVLRNLEGKTEAERDALLLGRLSWSTQGTIPLLTITSMAEAGLFDIYLELLDRRGLTIQADALRTLRDAYPNWNTTARDRYYQWSDGKGKILNPTLDAVAKEQSKRFVNAKPGLLETAQDILSTDPSFESYMAKREGIGDDVRLRYLFTEIGACVAHWGTVEEAQAALATLPQPLADLHMLDLMLLETGNGGFHQYVFNSTGTFAPDLVDTLTRLELDAHAKAVTDSLKVFSAPYPRETKSRRQIMQLFLKSQDRALNEATWIADDGATVDAAIALAKREGYWPG